MNLENYTYQQVTVICHHCRGVILPSDKAIFSKEVPSTKLGNFCDLTPNFLRYVVQMFILLCHNILRCGLPPECSSFLLFPLQLNASMLDNIHGISDIILKSQPLPGTAMRGMRLWMMWILQLACKSVKRGIRSIARIAVATLTLVEEIQEDFGGGFPRRSACRSRSRGGTRSTSAPTA